MGQARGEEVTGMRLWNRSKLFAFLGLFLVCGFLHVFTFHRDLMECVCQCFCGSILVSWGCSLHFRVTDQRLRRLLWAVVMAPLLFLALQVLKYCLAFERPSFIRLCWYAYYCPIMALPVLLLAVSEAIYLPPEQPLPKWIRVVPAAGAALVLLVLTNDLHQLVFRFHSLPFRDEDKSAAVGLYVFFVFFTVVLILAFRTILKKAKHLPIGPRRWLPTVPMILLGIWLLLNLLQLRPRLRGIPLWNIGECFCFATMVFCESCIQIGLIPANTDYGRLFSLGELSAVILDEQGRPVYRSGGESWPFPEREDLEVRRVPIPGGSLEWAADLSDLAALNAQIKENNRRLAQRNAFLREEGRLKKEHAELETRNQLYEQISRAVGPQLEEIGALAESDGDAFLGSLPRICVLTAFIKRRSNMELLSKDGTLPVEELAAALEESMEYLRLCGIAAAVQRFAKGVYPAQVIIAAYEHTQAIVMEGLDTLTAVSVIVRDAAGLELRLLVKAQSLSWDFGAVPPGISGVQPRIQVTKEGEDLTIVLRFPGGGGIVP